MGNAFLLVVYYELSSSAFNLHLLVSDEKMGEMKWWTEVFCLFLLSFERQLLQPDERLPEELFPQQLSREPPRQLSQAAGSFWMRDFLLPSHLGSNKYATFMHNSYNTYHFR